ncbi:conserved hypothetical protein [Gloeothece citriformis PCC 7424]|uniref:Uncharacterized protein n=1 Tax=Gloeothece citriformis (strain PCC 7424) TaxID=65393 RepID=B7K756_GLOC7|nr:hypothetical protein [Gloeothece citriformis]ACK69624.1 conserved hypothetical protein [Gloeothece citriformis PCC 7424]
MGVKSNQSQSANLLNYTNVYRCPVCRHGEISNLSLMDAFACNFCNHIFSADLEQQVIQMADSQLALKWRWNGRSWQGVRGDGVELTWGYWLAGIVFVLLPTAIVSLSAYLFPPLPGSRLSWLPVIWVLLTFLSHLCCLIWLIIEYYQFPVFRYFRVLTGRFLTRFQFQRSNS